MECLTGVGTSMGGLLSGFVLSNEGEHSCLTNSYLDMSSSSLNGYKDYLISLARVWLGVVFDMSVCGFP